MVPACCELGDVFEFGDGDRGSLDVFGAFVFLREDGGALGEAYYAVAALEMGVLVYIYDLLRVGDGGDQR